MTHPRIHKLALLTLTLFAALPLAAQTQRPEVVFHVQVVQANQAARNAIANVKKRQSGNFHRDDQITIHVLNDRTDAPSLVSNQRGRNDLDIVTLPTMTTTVGRDAHFLFGGRYPLPDVSEPGTSRGNRGNSNRNNRNGNGNGNGNTPNNALGPEDRDREFGVRLTMRALPLPNGLLRVRVIPRVQSVNFDRTYQAGDRTIPTVVTRQTSRAVDLKPGQSFAITGVLNAQLIQQLRQIPGLRNQHLIKSLLDAPARRPNSQLVLLVTPELQPTAAD